ncbi:hypothetical protein CEXT_751841 [Caerostris extrusa]|uniref:Uncharacterized protein n=1 Tax=Caerostris extrusa TaxID=172846 RepID=A0AAV4Y9G0_CAEEX|nr:hypothetical protein CEXT_751841 [Caerostris extrusa]
MLSSFWYQNCFDTGFCCQLKSTGKRNKQLKYGLIEWNTPPPFTDSKHAGLKMTFTILLKVGRMEGQATLIGEELGKGRRLGVAPRMDTPRIC